MKTEKIITESENLFGSRLQKLRKENGYSRVKLYDLIVSSGSADQDASKSTTVKNWETGKTNLGIQEINKICDLFNVSSDYLLGRDSCRNRDVQYIYEQTGLSEKAIETILEYKNREEVFALQILESFLVYSPYESQKDINDFWIDNPIIMALDSCCDYVNQLNEQEYETRYPSTNIPEDMIKAHFRLGDLTNIVEAKKFVASKRFNEFVDTFIKSKTKPYKI